MSLLNLFKKSQSRSTKSASSVTHSATQATAPSASPKTNDQLWGEMNLAYSNHIANGDFGLARNDKLDMVKLLEKEGRNLDAIDSLCAVIVHDLSGAGNSYNHQLFLETSAQFLFPYAKSLATIPPAIVKMVKKNQKKAEITDTELADRMLLNFQRLANSTPIHIFTPEEHLQVFNMEASGDKEGLIKLYKKAKKRFYENYPMAKR
jgi:hypothetical protein